MDKSKLVEVERISESTFPRRKKIAILTMGMGSAMILSELAERITTHQITNVGLELIGATVACITILFLHEVMHALAFKLCGGKFKIGMKFVKVYGLVGYATSPDTIITRKQMIGVLLAPQIMTVLIILMGLLTNVANSLLAYWLIMVGGANLCGGCIDIYFANKFIKDKRELYVEDTLGETILYQRIA